MKPRVLVVDDEVEFAQLVAYNLEQQGCEVITAHDGMHALKLSRSELPEVILLDLMLPDLDGLAVCQILRAQPSTRDIPVFIVSALGESWAAARKVKVRVARYFTKPVNFKDLTECVCEAAERRQKLLRSKCDAKRSG